MALFDPSLPFLGLAFTNPEGGHVFTMDIHPSRWTCTVSFEDALCSVIADHHHTGTIGDEGDSPWDIGGVDNINASTTHPEYTIATGGLAIHTGPPVPGSQTIQGTATHIILPDGQSWDRTLCSPAPFIPYFQDRGMDAIKAIVHTQANPSKAFALHTPDSPHRRVFWGVAMGVAAAFEGVPFTPWGGYQQRNGVATMAGTIGARLALLHATLARSGQQAQEIGKTLARDNVQSVIGTWMLRPDRAWMPNVWRAAPDLHVLLACLDPVDVAAGQAAARAVFARATTSADVHALLHPNTAHEVLAKKALDRAIDTALLSAYAATPDRLKPMAAHRSKALRA